MLENHSKTLISTIFKRHSSVNDDHSQYKIVKPLFGAADDAIYFSSAISLPDVTSYNKEFYLLFSKQNQDVLWLIEGTGPQHPC